MWISLALILCTVGAFMFGYGWHMGQRSEAYSALGFLIVGAGVWSVGGLIAIVDAWLS